VLDLGRSNPICKLLFTYYFFNWSISTI
jgi:hypothetical protein